MLGGGQRRGNMEFPTFGRHRWRKRAKAGNQVAVGEKRIVDGERKRVACE